MKTLHPKIIELKKRSKPYKESRAYIDKDGNLVDLKIDTSEDRVIKGYLAVFGRRDSYGTMPIKGCFAKSLKDRGPESVSKFKIPFLWQHELDNPIGQFRVLKEDDYGLYFEAVVDDVPEAERALRQINSGTLNQFSYGFDYIWDKMEYDEGSDSILMYEVDLYEGSVVTLASERETYAIRSVEDLEERKLEIHEEIEDFIKTIPRKKQIELRKLLSTQISLLEIEPNESRSLDNKKPEKQNDSIDLSQILNVI